MLGGIWLAIHRTPGVISLFKTLNSTGDKTMPSGETRERRLPLLGTATASPGEARPSKTQRYDEGCLLDFPHS